MELDSELPPDSSTGISSQQMIENRSLQDNNREQSDYSSYSQAVFHRQIEALERSTQRHQERLEQTTDEIAIIQTPEAQLAVAKKIETFSNLLQRDRYVLLKLAVIT